MAIMRMIFVYLEKIVILQTTFGIGISFYALNFSLKS